MEIYSKHLGFHVRRSDLRKYARDLDALDYPEGSADDVRIKQMVKDIRQELRDTSIWHRLLRWLGIEKC